MSIEQIRWHNLTGWGRAHVCWAAIVVGGFAIMLVGAALSEQPEGTCSGIGFGCQPSGPDWAMLLLIFFGPVVAVVLTVGHAVIAVVHALHRRFPDEHRQQADQQRSVPPQPDPR